MNILAIGNSFSEDATRYLHQIAKCDNTELTIVNLHIGGCPLSLHYKNILSDARAYELQFNGEKTGFNVSVKDALLNRDWNYVTFQQVSHQSISYDTYQPYLSELSAYVKKLAPKAKQLIHQTWSYEQGSKRLCDELGYNNQADMFYDLKKAYDNAASDINAAFIIPSGELFQRLLKSGIEKIHRDTFHASYGAGRYALSLLWYSLLTSKDIQNNCFCDFDEPIGEDEIKILKECVKQTIKENV